MPFAPTIFGSELAHILNTLAAVQAEESKRFNRLEHRPLMATFTNPVGTSWFEADMLTRHFYANQDSLEALLASDCVPGARETFEWRPREGLGLTMLQTRQMLLSRFVEVASSLQPALAPSLPPPVTQTPVTRWPPAPPQAPSYGGLKYDQYYQQLRRAETTRLANLAPVPDWAEEWEPPSPSSPPSRAPIEAATLPPANHFPSPEARTSPANAVDDTMDTGALRQSPGSPAPAAYPVAPPRREPRWLLPRADSVPPTSPGSEAEDPTEQRARLEPPNLTDAGWFSGGNEEDKQE